MNKAEQRIRTVLRLAALVTFVLGILTLYAPSFVIQIYEGKNMGGNHLVRFIGASLIGFAVTNWVYSKLTNIVDVLPAVYGNVTSLGLAVMIDVISLINDNTSNFVWYVLILHTTFFAAFAYCIFVIKGRLSKY